MRVTITVNGERREADDVWEGESLLYVLRERMGLPGSKNACEQGECGSCTVYLDGVTCCACLVAAGQADGRRVGHGRGAQPARQPRASSTRCSRRSSRPAPSSAASARPACSSPPTTCWRATPDPDDSEIREALAGNLCRCTGYEKIIDAVRLAAEAAAMSRSVVDGCAVVTMDAARTEHAVGHVVVDGARIASVGEGPRAPRPPGRDVRRRHRLPRDARAGQHPPPPLPVADPRLGRRPHALRVADHALPGVGRARRGDRRASAPPARWSSSRGPAAPRPWTTTTSSPPTAATCSPPRSRRRARSGCGSCPRGARWTSAARRAGCRRTTWSRRSTRSWPPRPPRSTGTTTPRRTRCCASASRPARRSRSPATCWRRRPSSPGTRASGCTPTSPRPPTRRSSAARSSAAPRSSTSSPSAGSGPTSGSPTGCTSTTERSRPWPPPGPASRTARPRTPGSAPAICRTRDLHAAGVPVGLGVDGAASNEAASLVEELRHSVLFARAVGGPTALTVRQGLELATIGGARVLGWDDRIGSLEPGKQADLALWRVDTAAHAGIADPVAALVLGTPPPLELLLVQGRPVVRHDAMVDVDEERLAVDVRTASETLLAKAVTRMTGATTETTRVGAPGGVGESPLRPGRDPQGHRGVRLRQRPLDGRHAVGRHAAQPAPVRPDRAHRPHRGAQDGRGLRGADPRRRARLEVLRPRAPGPAGAGGRRRSATRASRWRWSPRTIPRPPAGPRRRSSSSTRCSSRSPTRAPRCSRPAPRLHPGGNLVRHVKIRTGDPDPTADGRGLRRLRGRHAGPGVPRARVRARGPRRHRRRRPLRRHPVAARRPAAGLRGASASARTGCGSSWPASAARSAAARTCRCTCTAACSRCTPASR